MFKSLNKSVLAHVVLSVLALLTSSARGQADGYAHIRSEIRTRVYLIEPCCSQVSAYSAAWASEFVWAWDRFDCVQIFLPQNSGSEADIDIAVAPNITSTFAEARPNFGSVNCYAVAQASSQMACGDGSPIIDDFSGTEFIDTVGCPQCRPGGHVLCHPTGAFAFSLVQFESSCINPLIDVDVELNTLIGVTDCFDQTIGGSARSAVRQRAVIRPGNATPIVSELRSNAAATGVINLTNPYPNNWKKTVRLTMPTGSNIIRMRTGSIRTGQFDANADGRFNYADVDQVAAWVNGVGTPTIAQVSEFDLNQSGALDTSDVTELESILDDGFGNGLFGDGNHDGAISCTDVSAVTFGVDLSSASYKFEADWNLDGLLDASDNRRYFAATHHADWNLDGFIDFFDFDDFDTAFTSGDPESDWNLDGFIDFFDYDGFVDDFQNGC